MLSKTKQCWESQKRTVQSSWAFRVPRYRYLYPKLVVALLVFFKFLDRSAVQKRDGMEIPIVVAVPDDNHEETTTETKCRYHGNCPIGEVCQDGLCSPYRNSNSTLLKAFDQQRVDKCWEACLVELQADEWYYHDAVPVVQAKDPSEIGCILTYRRQPKKGDNNTNPPWTPPTMEEWMQQRFRRVIRTDPVVAQDHIWQALCAFPCETNADCPQPETTCLGRQESDIPPKISGSPKTCSRRQQQQDEHQDDMMIVSGANPFYFEALENFAASLRFWSPNSKLAVYSLGLLEEQLAQVAEWPNVHRIHWKDGFPASFPPHVKELKQYAWKPLAINASVHEYKSIFWLDAGAVFVGPLDPIQDILHRDGIFLVQGQDDDMKRLSVPGTYQWLGFDKDTFVGGPNFAGGVQGHVYPSRYIDTIVVPNAECAWDPACIAPEGSGLNNHRYDQTSLSILAHQHHVLPHHYTEYLAGGIEQLNQNRQEPKRFIFWTARRKDTYFTELASEMPLLGKLKKKPKEKKKRKRRKGKDKKRRLAAD
ncbi:expressed unknown protein [Seminavis robusta]|uniref:Uncharacterized protein n=1 Tax=Seminavis robusta TaxID=568900 RepID=A0A9N8HLC7_9STRA|nr:expressed unknown protein [Seminavis robusta]|eukprot:Sro673_g185200.1 n/a (536) ;mRNA; f:16729-18336